MNIDELGVYLEGRPEVVWATDDDGNLYLRHSVFDKEDEKLKLEPGALQKLTSQLVKTQEAERRRLSLELHDEMGQALTAIKINVICLKM